MATLRGRSFTGVAVAIHGRSSFGRQGGRGAIAMSGRRNIYLIQVNWSDTAGNTAGLWLPYSVGSIWASCKANAAIEKAYSLAGIVFLRSQYDSTLAHMRDPDIVGFSTYVWNERFNLSLAREIKSRWPGALIVFGGPQVPDRSREYFARNPQVDILVHGEGEEAFEAILLERLQPSPGFTNIPGCTINIDGVAFKTPERTRIYGLEELPSPYLTGVFDGMMSEYPEADWNTVIETNRGCPYRCIFCDWGTLTYSKMTRFPEERVADEIDWLGRHRVSYVMPADSNFGIFAERDSRIVDYFIESARRYGYPRSVGMNFAKNSNERIVDMAERLHRAHLLKALTLSAQSMTPAVLVAIERQNMKINRFEEILDLCNSKGIPYYTELILGLPNETYASWVDGLCNALECGQHHQLETWLLEILENAPLNDPALLGRYGIKTVVLKNYCFVFDLQDRDDIPEQIPIVYETNTMPFEDMVRSLGFSMLIFNCHAFGWTQYVARYLRVVHDVPFKDFYQRLQTWMQRHSDSILFEEYEHTIDTFREMIATKDYLIDRFLLGFNVGSVPLTLRSQGFLHLEETRTRAAVREFVAATYGASIGALLDEVLSYQEHVVSSPYRSYPYELDFSLDLQAVFRGEKPATGAVRYRFDAPVGFSDIRDYLTKLYAKKKAGFGKAIVSRVESTEGVVL